MPQFCSACGAQMAENTGICPACGKPVAQAGGAAAAPGSAQQAGGLQENVAGMLAYITIIPAILFLILEPYNKNKFVRFHSFQCLFVAVAWIVLSIAMMVLDMVPGLALLMFPLHMLIALGFLVLWVVLLVKAYQHQMWKVPVIGDMAEKQANA